ncbi:unnamed protein product [Rotaria sp. Silwood1]|nr:unnamed protein product [Rotaria sp. Silwood1]CAF1657679.1 unnamed protein product [Rotaria sp. Silwood1]
MPSTRGNTRGFSSDDDVHLRSTETFHVTVADFNERINRVHIVLGLEQDMLKAYPEALPARYVVGIQFFTTHNRSSLFYGSKQGESIVEEFKDGFVIGYVRGASGTFIDRLQFIWYKT